MAAVILIAGTLRIAPGQREAAIARFKPGIEAARAEPGCLGYSFAFDVLDETLIHIFEIYKDQAAVDAHRANLAARAASAPAGPAIEVIGRDLNEYDVSAARQL